MTLRRPVLCLLVLLPAGCREVGGLYPLTGDLNREFPDTRIGVALTDGVILTVTMRDSPLFLASCAAQAGLAVRVVTVVRQHYPGFDSLMVVNIAFTSSTAADTTKKSPARLPFRFAPAAVRAGLGASDSAAAAANCRAFEELQ